jgi:hypothetical protein
MTIILTIIAVVLFIAVISFAIVALVIAGSKL